MNKVGKRIVREYWDPKSEDLVGSFLYFATKIHQERDEFTTPLGGGRHSEYFTNQHWQCDLRVILILQDHLVVTRVQPTLHILLSVNR